MVLGFFRKNPRRAVIATLYDRIATAARDPALYRELGVPDTVEGRFEALALHMILVLRRLRQLPPPADEVAQELVDFFFGHMDASLREMGVGDFGVPKRIHKLAEAFYGRTRAYDAALDETGDDALAAALARNVGETDRPADALARYVRASAASLADAGLDALLTTGPRFAEPGSSGGRP